MHASILILTIFFLHFEATLQLPQDSGNIDPQESLQNPQANCVTAKSVKGACVERSRCDYGTNAIDFTLYAPRRYKKPCADNEVCCPFAYIIVQTEPAANVMEEDLSYEI